MELLGSLAKKCFDECKCTVCVHIDNAQKVVDTLDIGSTDIVSNKR